MSKKISKYLWYVIITIIALYLVWLIYDNYQYKKVVKEDNELINSKLSLLKGKWIGSYFQDTLIVIRPTDTSKTEIKTSEKELMKVINREEIESAHSNLSYQYIPKFEDSIEFTFDGKLTRIYHHETKTHGGFDSCTFDTVWEELFFYKQDSLGEWKPSGFPLIKLDADSLIMGRENSGLNSGCNCVYKFKRIK